MTESWLKRYLPRGLYGRAALILILPIVTIQLVVSIAFIQRYFTDVTTQMAASVVLELRQIDRELRSADTAAEGNARAGALADAFTMTFEPAPRTLAEAGTARHFYDLSGRALARAFETGVPGFRALDLTQPDAVHLTVDGPFGPYAIGFDRGRTTARNPHQLLVYLVVTGLMMMLVAFIFLRNQLRPIRRLAAAAEAFGKGRVVPYRPAGAVEVRAAGAAFLDMRARIERQMEQRTTLLSGVSHDLRTPLTRLKLGLAMLGEGPEVAALERDVEDMRKMLDAFLAFARSDATDEAAAPVDPVALARALVEDARRAGARAVLRSVEGEGRATLREGAVRRALDNLLSNAVTYGKRAELSVAILEKSVRYTVEDDGPGIPEDRRDEALKPFTRLEPARNQDRGTGVGLGLAITADIARSHGGSLRLGVSERLGGLKAELVLAR
jgi:two-component system osmolarity sensor histidine kinase EnvZ